jgi:vacuolar-type H+-ATPase subunit H
MEKVISLLFDIERKANQIIERANIEKNTLYEENENAIAEMEAGIANENNTKINQIMAQAEKEIEQEKQHLIDNCEKQLADLERYYVDKHDVMVNKIFKSIIEIQS